MCIRHLILLRRLNLHHSLRRILSRIINWSHRSLKLVFFHSLNSVSLVNQFLNKLRKLLFDSLGIIFMFNDVNKWKESIHDALVTRVVHPEVVNHIIYFLFFLIFVVVHRSTSCKVGCCLVGQRLVLLLDQTSCRIVKWLSVSSNRWLHHRKRNHRNLHLL